MFSTINIVKFTAAIIISYFLGNLSPASLVGKAAGVNIREQGSGNPGTTNVLRTLGKKAAVTTLVIDILKGVAAVLIGKYIGGEWLAHACGLAVFIGHVWPVCYKFKGGKGVATCAGIMLTTDWRAGLICIGAAFLGMAITQRVSWGSITGAIAIPVTTWFFTPDYVLWGIILAAIIIFRHRTNIKRIINGEEPKLNLSKGK